MVRFARQIFVGTAVALPPFYHKKDSPGRQDAYKCGNSENANKYSGEQSPVKNAGCITGIPDNTQKPCTCIQQRRQTEKKQ
jgi:hypothetical protein